MFCWMPSVTYKVPEGDSAKPMGKPKLAEPPCPSDEPDVVLPANVLTNLPGEIALTMWLPESATNTVPVGDTATPLRVLKLASVPCPLANLLTPLPASVLTSPPGVIALTI